MEDYLKLEQVKTLDSNYNSLILTNYNSLILTKYYTAEYFQAFKEKLDSLIYEPKEGTDGGVIKNWSLKTRSKDPVLDFEDLILPLDTILFLNAKEQRGEILNRPLTSIDLSTLSPLQ